MNILDGLLGEHAALLTLFEHLDQSVTRMDLHRLRETGLLLERMLMTHSIAEDRYLFDSVPETNPQHAAGLHAALKAMHAEHQQLAIELHNLHEADNEASARGCLQRVMQAAREHFEVEERVLFRAAANKLSAGKLEELGSAWKRYRMKEAQP